MNLHATATVPIAGITGLIRLAQDLAYSLICTHFTFRFAHAAADHDLLDWCQQGVGELFD